MSFSQQYYMKWDNFHNHLGHFFSNLYESEELADVSIYADGHIFKCHKIILSAGSPYFHEILNNVPCKHPVVILSGIKVDDVRVIINFIYKGELGNIDYDQFVSVLKAAESLKINGLTEIINHLPAYRVEETGLCDSNEVINEKEIASEKSQVYVSIQNSTSEKSFDGRGNYLDNSALEKRKHLKDSKKYSDGRLYKALRDMERGVSLMEASRIHKIPRSTLYSKAKQHSGLSIVTRKEYSSQECHPALQAVTNGMSLKRASEVFNIPKTVLWRRVRKSYEIRDKCKSRQRYGKEIEKVPGNNDCLPEENLVDVNGAKRTSDLAENGESKSQRQARLSQAVNACKQGKMSHATASSTFQVPKTTIWRRLQKSSVDEEASIEETESQHLDVKEQSSDEIFYTENNEVTVKYESGDFSEAPIIIINSSAEPHHEQRSPEKQSDQMDIVNVEIFNTVEIESDNRTT